MAWLLLAFIVLCIIAPKVGWYVFGAALALFLAFMAGIMTPSTPVPVTNIHPNGLDNNEAIGYGFFIFIGVIVAFYFLAQWDNKRREEEKKKATEAYIARVELGLRPHRRWHGGTDWY